MIKKVIVLVFVSFFVMSGLTILTENNHNYNISNNYFNNFVVPSSKSIVNLSYISDFNLSNVLINNGESASYNSNLYYLGEYNSNYYVYKYSVNSNSISQFVKLPFVPINLGIYSSCMYITSNANNNSFISINLTNDIEHYYGNFEDSVWYGTPFFYNNTVIEFIYSSPNYYLITYSLINKEITNTYSLQTSPFAVSYATENGNYFYFTVIYGTNFVSSVMYGLNLKDLSQSPILKNIAISPLYSFNNYSYFPSSYFGWNFLTSSNLIEFITNSSTYFPYQLSESDYNNFSFSPYNFYDSSLGNKSIDFYPHFINGYKDNTFLYSTLNNQKYYMSLPFNFSSSKTYFLAQGKSYLYMINPYNDMVYIFKNPVGSLYYLTVKSYNSLSSQINNYLLFNGQLTTTSISISNSYPCLPTIIPLNYSTYYYNGSKIIITSSDYTGSFNKYYNLSIYYNQVQAPSIPLYDIFTYMYPISIIGLFVGMGAFVFTIKKRGYKI